MTNSYVSSLFKYIIIIGRHMKVRERERNNDELMMKMAN